MRNRYQLHFLVILFGVFASLYQAQAQKIKSAAFTYAPEAAGDQYNQRIPKKAFSVSPTDFVILSRKSDNSYAVERYGEDLKARWSTKVNLLGQETVEAFSQNQQTVMLITHRVMADQGSQALYGRLFDVASGKELKQTKLVEAPSRSRRPAVAVSADGSKIVAYHAITRNEELKSMQATVYDASLAKIKDRTYDFAGAGTQVSAQVQVDNHGNQFVSVLTNNSMRLSVRRYNNRDNEIKVMEVMLGGVFNGEKMYVLDTHFQLHQDSSLYAAVLVAEEKSGDYRSLKMVRFDYAAGNMRFAEEFQFTPAFTAQLAKATGEARLQDIYLSDILISSEGQTLVMAEKKYTEGGENSDYHAKEILLFAYNEYLQPTWNSVIIKNQVAPSTEGFAGISYSAHLVGNRLQLLTLETLKGKTDLYTRSIHLVTGAAEPPKAVGLNVANDKQVAFVKDFTTWLDERTITAVNRPSKASAGLRLSRITFKN
ncbi:hypothetical protein ACD591_13435 [Rufibacter glacialis]|uniref:S9 family peptidase n=1 Tax=Rufibacter glacialis TaxID=1259555 RepID=A0A5M8Q7A8_9BACT|nr:hypothetical protein [Rufibacter glacialis]KAA6431143.1 hypothetical protein FOE74_18790 [Rufibacter glacialis]GGK84352.1 hypothetical protein GCM10011405_35370 [Rufibacter glacialis]